MDATGSPGAAPAARSASRRRRLAELVCALPLAAALLYAGARAATGDGGLAVVDDDEVAVVDRFLARRAVASEPGWILCLPWLERVDTVSRGARVVVFEGGDPPGGEREPRLVLRAKDGSAFWLDSARVEYGLREGDALRALDDGASDPDRARGLVAAHVRAALRDELGRYGPEEVARPDVRQAAVRAAVERLDRELAVHAIDVLDLALAKPSFDPSYEDQINRRKIADQEVERLVARRDQLEQEKEQKEVEARAAKEIELAKLESEVVRDLAAAEREEIRLAQEAEAFAVERAEASRAQRRASELQASVLAARHQAQAGDLARQTREVERHGELGVRTALVERLGRIEFQLVPYNRDPAPSRVEYESVPMPAPKGGGK